VWTREDRHLYSVTSVELGGDLPWPEGLCVLNSEQRSPVESVVKEAVKGGETAAGTIVEEVMGERHLIDDNGPGVWTLSGECSRVVCSEVLAGLRAWEPLVARASFKFLVTVLEWCFLFRMTCRTNWKFLE
jgi:hypothetical protein